MAEKKYMLRVTAGPSYDESTHVVVPVNTANPTPIHSPHCTANLKVRVQNFRGLPRNLPSTSPYFSNPPHVYDMYSISFAFIPHETISSKDLIFGNDFDRPIRDRLPPGFQTGFKIVKWAVDPGLDGDVMADKPYLYGSALGSWNVLRVGTEGKTKGEGWEVPAMEDGEDDEEEDDDDDEEEKTCISEGADGDGVELREKLGCPDTSAARQKWALRDDGGKAFWEWQKGRIYRVDFFNPYLDFNEFALKLPGFSLSILPLLDRHGDGALDGEQLRPNHDLRYVLKHKDSEVFFVVIFTMVRTEDAKKEEGEAGKSSNVSSSAANKTEFQPAEDDVD